MAGLVASLTMRASACLQDRITLSEKNAPVKAILQEIRKQAGYYFVFDDKWEERLKPVTIDVTDATVEEVLTLCFKNQPFTFSIVDKMILIKEKVTFQGGQNANYKTGGNSIPEKTVSERGPREVKGVVRSESGEPLGGATVTIRKLGKYSLYTETGTTNEKGEFSLKNIPNGTYAVEVTFVGFEHYYSEVKVLDNEIRVGVEMKKKKSTLDDVQVIAYGTTTQRYSTGDVTTVKAADIEKQPVSNPLLALEGRVPGLFIVQNTGLSGSGVTVQIRGQNSIFNGNDPFYVIDGVPYPSQLLPNLGGILGGGGGNGAQSGSPLSFINPSDIESISVLKDADATAIYGSRAANGAILITTKKGKAGKTKVDINLQNGWGKVTRTLKLLNTPQYLQMRHEAINNDGLTVGSGDYDINGVWDTTRYTDWQKTLVGGSAEYTNISASVSGGNENIQYMVEGTFHRETTVFPGGFTDQKGSVHFNINNASANQKFRFQLSGSYMVDDNHLPGGDLTSPALLLAPDAPPLLDKNGKLNWAPDATGATTFFNNPITYIYGKYQNKANNLVSNAILSYQILPGLDIKTSMGYTNLQTDEVITEPLIAFYPEEQAFTQRRAQYGNNAINTWIIEPQVHYKYSFGKGRMEALLGTTLQQNNSKGQQLIGIGYNSDLVLEDIMSANKVTAVSSIASVYKYNALFSRLSFNWDDKYLLNLSARKDGSSRFGPANQFHGFGSIGAGWIFSKEDFIQNSIQWLSFGKLRFSYGITGNDQIGDYKFLDLYSPTSVGNPYQGVVGLQPNPSNGLANPFLEWEETKKLELGLDLGFLSDRVVLNSSYFRNRSSNQLIGYSLPIITGFYSITKNFPATVQNSGWEFSFNSSNIKNDDFSWSTHINLTIPQNKLIAFPNLANSTYRYGLIIGQPISIQHVFHLLGVDPATGIYQFGTGHGTVTNLPDTDYITNATVLINTLPSFFGGIENSFRYKGFELNFLFQFVKQKGLNYQYPGNIPGFVPNNQPISVWNRWQKPGDIKPIQRYNSNLNLEQEQMDAGNSDAAYSDASYIRLKTLSLSWQFPATWTKSIHLQYATLYLQGQNLLTITHYQGLDPENSSVTSIPPLRVLTMGVKIGL